tara:strand:+ start:102 stop:395 length:294 start_codon:yes stop_codon:yes gene_type:complete
MYLGLSDVEDPLPETSPPPVTSPAALPVTITVVPDEDEGVAEALLRLQEMEEFKAARERITPWLWIFSLGSFILAMNNSSRIKKMYGSWKKAKRELL